MIADIFDVTGLTNKGSMVITATRNSRVVQAYIQPSGLGDDDALAPYPIANPLKLPQGEAIEILAGDLIDIYAFCSELGYVLIGSCVVRDPDVRLALLPYCTYPVKTDGTDYSWASGWAKSALLKIYNLGRYAGTFAGHSYSNVLSTNLPAISPIVLTIGEDVYYIGDPRDQLPGNVNVTVFDESYEVAALDLTGYVYPVGSHETISASCSGAQDVVSVLAPHSNYLLPISIPYTYTSGVVTLSFCTYEPWPIITFERNSRLYEATLSSTNNPFTFPTGAATVLTAAGTPFTCEGATLSSVDGAYITNTLSGYEGDLVTYEYSTTAGSFTLESEGVTYDLRETNIVSYAIYAPKNFINASEKGVLTRHKGAEGFDLLSVNAAPLTSFNVTCVIDGVPTPHEVTIPEGGGSADWRIDTWWDDPVIPPDNPPDDPFTPEARIIKLHVVNNGDVGDIVIEVTKPTSLITTEVETFTPAQGETDYLLDMDTYGLPGVWLSKRFHAEITLPGGKQTVAMPWPDASTQLNIIYGTNDPQGGEGSELGFIVVVNDTAKSVTLNVRTNHLSGGMDVVGSVDPYSTSSFPILSTYINPLAPEIIRCKLVGVSGTQERDYEYPASHIIHITYGANPLDSGSPDYMKYVKYVLMGGAALMIFGLVFAIIRKV